MSSVFARPNRRGLAGLVAAGMLLQLLLPLAASAHSELHSSVPPEGSVVPSPFSGPVVLTFTESLAVGSKADLYGPGHQLISSATIEAGTMTVSLPSPLAPGDFTVEWVSIGDDGDLLRGIVGFSVVAASPTSVASVAPSPSTPSTTPATSASTAATSTPAAAAPASTAPDAGGTGSDVILPIVIALIVAAAGALYLVRRNRPA